MNGLDRMVWVHTAVLKEVLGIYRSLVFLQARLVKGYLALLATALCLFLIPCILFILLSQLLLQEHQLAMEVLHMLGVLPVKERRHVDKVVMPVVVSEQGVLLWRFFAVSRGGE